MTDKDKTPKQSTIIPSTFSEVVNVSKWHLNVDQECFVITEDRVRLLLNSHLTKIEKSKGYIAPLGIFITIAITLVTGEFKENGFMFPPATWQAIFFISGILSFAWLVYSVWQARQSETIEDLIKRMKREAK